MPGRAWVASAWERTGSIHVWLACVAGVWVAAVLLAAVPVLAADEPEDAAPSPAPVELDDEREGARAADREPAAREVGEVEEEGFDELDPEPTGGEDEPETITVVARRRTERLEDTPVAVTALGQTLLEEAQIREMDQVQDFVPNLTWNTGFSGIQSSVSVRGVGKASEDVVFDPGVGIYVDGVLLSRDVGQLLPMIDVKQVEVLRGPQGTLFGKNNVGGAVNMITVKPQDEFEARLKVGAGNYYSYRSRAMVNIPVVQDKLFMRASWASEHNDGYMANVVTGQRANDRGLTASLLSFRALPTERLTIDVSGSWSRDHTGSRGGKCIFVGPSIAAQVAESGLTGPAFPPGSIQSSCQLSELLPERQFTADSHLVADIESYGIWGTVAYDLGDLGPMEQVELKSITAWREQDPRQRDDTDMTRLAIIQRDTIGGMPTFFGGLTRPGWQQQITQELQVQNTWWDGRIHSTTGMYLFWDRAFANQELISLGGRVRDPGFLSGLAPTLQQTGIDNFDVAAYHQSTWNVYDWLGLTFGIRWTREEKNTDVFVYRFTEPPSAPSVDAFDAGSAVFEEWTPTVSVATKAPREWLDSLGVDALNAYFTYARGFKGGGFSAIQGGTLDSLDPFRPEFLDSFELGVKTRAFNSKLRAELALFYGLYDDLQVTVTRAGATPFQVERTVENAAEATTRGVELEIQALPFEGALVSGSVGFLDAKYDTYLDSANNSPRPLTNPPPASIDRSGLPFTGVPKWQTQLSAQYELAYDCRWSWLEGTLTPRLDWIFESQIQYGGFEVPALLQPSVHRLNARLTWRFNDEQSEVALWGRNLTDAYYFRNTVVGTASTYGFAVRYYEAPRTYGIELQHTF